MDNCYHKLSVKDNLSSEILKYISNTNNWRFHRDFWVHHLPQSLFRDSRIFEIIKEFNGEPIVFKMDPYTFYNWHNDAVRSCAINMLLDGSDSLSLFGNLEGEHHLWKFQEVPHEIDQYFLVNTLENHAVLNRSQTRYMLSIGFYLPIDFELVKSKCIHYNL